jgi:hypothetical protein
MNAHSTLEHPARVSAATESDSAKLLDIDPATFRANFAHTPFLIRHHLAGHRLLALPSLIELAQRLPERQIEYNAGNLSVNQDRRLTPHTGLSVDETIRRIEECRSWMVLKNVERDPAYHDLLWQCLREVQVLSEAITPGMCQAEAFVFVSSPGSVTPYHMDPEYNFLLQIRGGKTVHLFDPADSELVTEQDFEKYFAGAAQRNMVFRDEFQERARSFPLTPGAGLYFPVTAPHWVKNGDAVSISFSITFRTPALERRTMIHNFNAYLRGWGFEPTRYGKSPFKDALKYNLARAWRRGRRLFGKR